MGHGNNSTARSTCIVVCTFICTVLPPPLLGHILDTMCLTTSPNGDPIGSVNYLGIVSGFDKDANVFYRIGASTRNYEYYNRTIGNHSCHQTSSSQDYILCGFSGLVQISGVTQTEEDSPISMGRVTLTNSETKEEEEQGFLRFGVFQCEASKYDFKDIANVIIMSPEAVFKPNSFTITANLEDRVRLTMNNSTKVGETDIRWRHISRTGVKNKTSWRGIARPVIGKVSLDDAGVYEAYTMTSKVHLSGYMRLIVRGCRYNLWGYPTSCEHTCPVCYNGGICHDKSGRCVCPPGFTGDRCENACSRGFIGQRCDVECSRVSGNEDCRGTEICLPDPFGCSCAPGYKGLNCSTECSRGFYGAGCTQVCHCNSSSTCDNKTGLCTDGGCEESWKGPMCQVKVLVIYGNGFPAVVNTGKGGQNSSYNALTTANATELKFGREVTTGSGESGSGVSSLHGSNYYNRSDTGLPFLRFPVVTKNWRRGGDKFSFESDRVDEESLGVFYVEGIYRKRREHIPLVRMSNQARYVPKRITWTIGTGESVTLRVVQNLRREQDGTPRTLSHALRWRHNRGNIIERANGQTYLRITNARKADEGVYECFPQNAEEQDKAIMLLKVRSCPTGKWGVYCDKTCPVCYFEGICHDETGECVCHAGYKGRNCSEYCDEFGSFGPTCELRCVKRSKCKFTQICSPDPIGCHCRAGYMSERCNEFCQDGTFGPDCSLRRQCRSSLFDPGKGCSSSCHQNYEGPGCQEPGPGVSCDAGWYGNLCNYPCHCSNDQCDRTTGSCSKGNECAEGWGGRNCSYALPSLRKAPVYKIIDDELLILWELWRSGVDYGTGPVKSYLVKYLSYTSSIPSGLVNVEGYSVWLQGLDPREYYSITVAAITDVEGANVTGPESPTVRLLSPCGKPQFFPKIDNASSSTNADVLLKWQVEAPNKWTECDPLIRVYYRMTSIQHVTDYDTTDTNYNSTHRDIRLKNLKPCQTYDVKLAVIYSNGKTSMNSSSVTAETNSSGIFPEILVQKEDASPTTITITWQVFGEGDSEWSQFGDENQYKFIVTMETPGGESTKSEYGLTERSHSATDLDSNATYIFNITVEDCAGNKGPQESLNISTKAPATTPSPEYTSQYPKPESQKPQDFVLDPVVLPTSLSLLFILITIAVLLIFMIRRKKQRSTATDKVENNLDVDITSIEMMRAITSVDNDALTSACSAPLTESVTPSTKSVIPSVETDVLYGNLQTDTFCIALKDLHCYVQTKKLETDGFKKEFEELMKGKQKPCTVGETKANIKKNRFKNIVTYDHSRVKLPIINNEPSSDYFNASYINGYTKHNEFIASQGPNKASLNDFWRMIWYKKCQKIIMLTNIVEAGKAKCEQYWGDNDKPRLFADVCVKTTKQDRKGEVVTRHFSLSKNHEVHDVTQYHFTGWPDMGVPPSADVLWEILDEVEKDEDEVSPPIVVHCSAGCGRTGTFIALSTLRKMMNKERKINVFRYVNEMRGQRTTMVQTCDQYQFVYESLLTYGLVGKTSIRGTDFSDILKNMKSLNGNQSVLEQQFCVLKYLSPSPDHLTEQCGSMPINVTKNRFQSMIPVESFRPKLMTAIEDPTATDYINASFCDGHKHKDLFVSAQTPLSNTVVDFWRLVYDYKCYVVVFFQNGSNEDQSSMYIPSEGRSQYGPFSVETVEKDEMAEISEKTFHLTKSNKYYLGEHKPYIINHFDLHKSVMGDKAKLLDLVERVQRKHRQQKEGRIALLCWNGVDINSIFMAIYNSCERLRDDGIVNLFSVVRHLRERSPQMVGTMEQYEFCMDTIQHQIDSTSLYANT